ncbi:hypothetical protein MTR_6g012235 [Medicago truncatula]|uniref:Uncharacterized protein n=1 Tax=Medicago truncatula TaxID=3880 RepID=A0A072U7C1_MEDTR|nr:hypothetical protein MTR_6g012235 [Medicago truncatula]
MLHASTITPCPHQRQAPHAHQLHLGSSRNYIVQGDVHFDTICCYSHAQYFDRFIRDHVTQCIQDP